MQLKYEGKLAQIEDSHKEEMERLNRRHMEQMKDLTNRMSYANKKG